MSFEHLQRRTINFDAMFSAFDGIIERTRKLNPALGMLLDNVQEYWDHRETDLALETLLDYVVEGDNLSDTYDIRIEGKIRMEMLIFDVVKALQILEYLGSDRHDWQSFEVLFFDYK